MNGYPEGGLEALENEKLSLILELRENTLALSDLLTEDSVETAAPYLAKRRELQRLIDEHTLRARALYPPAPEAGKRLARVLFRQRELLREIASLNERLIARGEEVRQGLSDKIRSINRDKNILGRYHAGSGRSGFLLDFKEGR